MNYLIDWDTMQLKPLHQDLKKAASLFDEELAGRADEEYHIALVNIEFPKASNNLPIRAATRRKIILKERNGNDC